MFYKTLVLSGGGSNGIGSVGALKKLHETKSIFYVQNYIGCSIGSIICFFLAIGFTPIELYDEFDNFDAKCFKYNEVYDFFKTFGLESADLFMSKIVDITMKKDVSPLITFRQLKEKFNVNLLVVGSNVSTHKEVYFQSNSEYGEMKILDAIRVSIAIPLLFTPVKIDNEYYVDGGLSENYAMTYARKHFEGPYIGILLDSLNTVEIKDIRQYIYNIIATTRKYSLLEDTILIQIKNSPVDFDLTKDQKQYLLETGYNACVKYLEEPINTGNIIRRRSV